MLEEIKNELIKMGYDAEDIKDYISQNKQFFIDVIKASRQVELKQVVNPS
jgi:DUF438 domain-containing protein